MPDDAEDADALPAAPARPKTAPREDDDDEEGADTVPDEAEDAAELPKGFIEEPDDAETRAGSTCAASRTRAMESVPYSGSDGDSPAEG